MMYNVSKAITPYIKRRLSPQKNKVFVFGSALHLDHFRDIDIGIMGEIDQNQLTLLREDFEDSNFPYLVDIVDFNQVNPAFKEKVFQDKIVWLNF